MGVKPAIFPDWEILPYDRLSPHQDIVSERLSILSNMPQKGILLVSTTTLAGNVAPYMWVLGKAFWYPRWSEICIRTTKIKISSGRLYWLIPFMIMGNLRCIGSIMDIYASGAKCTYSYWFIWWWNEQFQILWPWNQRTTTKLERFTITSCKEFPLKARSTFRDRYAKVFNCKSKEKTQFIKMC